MATARGWLIDKSALARLGHTPDLEVWQQRIVRGLVRISSISLLEIGFSARSEHDWGVLLEGPPISDMPVVSVTPQVETRALEVQRGLSHHGNHRGPGPADLLIAAMAEFEDLTILHVDKAFDLIADVTGQPVERLTGEF